MIQVAGVQLAKQGIQPFAAFFATAQDDLGIVRGDHDSRKFADVLGKAFVGFIVEGNILFAIFDGAYNMFLLPVFVEECIDPEAIGIVLGILGFAAGKIAFCEAEVINGIQEVRLSGAVAPGDANDPLAKPVVGPGIVLKLY